MQGAFGSMIEHGSVKSKGLRSISSEFFLCSVLMYKRKTSFFFLPELDRNFNFRIVS